MEIDQRVGSWRELGSYLGVTVVLAGGVLVGAVSIYLAASLLPTAVAEIGGHRFYAWTMTAFLVAQVVATMVTARVLLRCGEVGSYLIGFAVFVAGSVICAIAPVMPVLLAGRGFQGCGAGLLTGLGFAVVRSALPQALWARGSAVISGMFGVGNFVGPALGGIVAQLGSWRVAFGLLGVVAALIAVVVPRALRPEPVEGPGNAQRNAAQMPVPALSLAIVVAAVAALSVASLVEDRVLMVILVGAAAALVTAFVLWERRSATRVLPVSTYRPGSTLRWAYLAIAILASAVAVETFLPLFAQQLGGLPPAAAGFFGAALSLGWSVTQIWSSSATGALARRLIIFGPVVLAAGLLGLGLLQRPAPALQLVILWLPVLIMAGAGIGLAMPHLSVSAMTSTTEADEGRQAAAAVATVLTIGTATGAAIAGLLVNLGAEAVITSARYLVFGFAVICGCGILPALRLTRSARNPSPVRNR